MDNSTKIRVVHICDKFGVKGSSVHGVSRLFTWWFPRFDNDLFDIKLIGLREEDESSRILYNAGIDIKLLNKTKYDFTTTTEIIRYVKEKKINIVHLHGYGSTTFGRIASKFTSVKNIVHEHFVDPYYPFLQKPFDQALKYCTDSAIAVSQSVKDFMINKRCLPFEKIQLIYNGAPTNDLKPVSSDLVIQERLRLGIDPDHKVVASIGRLDQQKGNIYLLKAAAKILKSRDKVRFMIIGDGPLKDDLQQFCKEHDIEKNVIFTGYISNIPLLQSLIDIQVFPSLWEGTPLTIFEAMSMEKAIVSTNVDGLGEVLKHNENALLVEPYDTESLASAIQYLLIDNDMCNTLSKNAKRDSIKYDIQKTVNKMQNIYVRLMNTY